MNKMRLDAFLAQKGYFTSREKAKQAILDGRVSVNGETVSVAKFLVDESDLLEIAAGTDQYVGRGAYKLKHALEHFAIDLKDAIVLDIGASTGGFTQVCLEHQAAMVYALDVGTDQLDPALRQDPRVVVMEQHNFRHAVPEWFPKPADFICCDVSFISLKHIIPSLAVASHAHTQCVLLIKPQFEAGKEHLNKHGVVTSRKIHVRVIHEILEMMRLHGIMPLHLAVSPITGKDGNIEYLVHGARAASFTDIDVETIVFSNWRE